MSQDLIEIVEEQTVESTNPVRATDGSRGDKLFSFGLFGGSYLLATTGAVIGFNSEHPITYSAIGWVAGVFVSAVPSIAAYRLREFLNR